MNASMTDSCLCVCLCGIVGWFAACLQGGAVFIRVGKQRNLYELQFHFNHM